MKWQCVGISFSLGTTKVRLALNFLARRAISILMPLGLPGNKILINAQTVTTRPCFFSTMPREHEKRKG